MQAQQQVMQKMQQRLEELEVKEQQQAAAKPAPAAPIVSAASAPSPATPPPYRPPSALAGTTEPLPEGYVRLGDTGNLLKLDLVAQLDAMVDIAMHVPGVIAARMTGAGFGGCTVNLVRPDAVQALRDAVVERYPSRTGLTPMVLPVAVTDGAGRLT